jgi:sarcosine oxidase subunit beta
MMPKKIFVPNQGESLSADVVVIGGGIVGVATAFWLSRAGLETLVVEMRDGLSTLTSAASIESFRKQFTEPGMAALAIESVDVWEHFGEVIGIPDYDIGLKHQGYLFITADTGKVEEMKKAVDQYHRLGVTDSEFLEGGEVRKRFPWASPKIVAGTYRRNDGWFSAHEATQGYVKGAAAKFLIRTHVTDILTDDKGIRAVETDRGTIQTRNVVNAAGPFAARIGRMVGLELPLEPVRRQKIYLSNQPLVPQDAPLSIDVDNESYWRPETGGAFAGWLDPDEPVTEPMDNPLGDWDFAALCMDKVAELTPFWTEIAANLKTTDLKTSAGQYVYTPDAQPLIGPVESVPGFYLNCGYWAGVMLSAGAGRWTAELMTGKMEKHKNPLRLSRFEEEGVSKGPSFLSGRH